MNTKGIQIDHYGKEMGGARSRLPGNPNEWQHVSGTDFYRRNNFRQDCTCEQCKPVDFWVGLVVLTGLAAGTVLFWYAMIAYSIGGW